MVFYLFSPDFARLIIVLLPKHFVFSYFCLDFDRSNPADYALVGFESSPLWHSQNLNGNHINPRGLTGSCTMRSLSFGAIPHIK